MCGWNKLLNFLGTQAILDIDYERCIEPVCQGDLPGTLNYWLVILLYNVV